MPSQPDAMVPLLSPFASLLDARTWRKAQILLPGIIPAPGRRTVSTALYALDLQGRGDFALYHHVQQLVPTGPLQLAIDETPGGVLTGVGKAPIRIFVPKRSYLAGGSTCCILSGGSGPGRGRAGPGPRHGRGATAAGPGTSPAETRSGAGG
ncbi:MAG: hypothetical protein OXC13_19485 [Caldilineaceae bacterium]|nr:hypothetical protein [Caldilineaceae bacterium]